MTPQRKHFVHLRGSEAYEKAVARVLRAARKDGVPINTINGLAEYGIAELAARYGVPLPPRANPNGRQPAKKSKKVTEKVVD